MEQEFVKRVEKLEAEIELLKGEIQRLKQPAHTKAEVKEKPLTKYFFPEKSETEDKASFSNERIANTKEQQPKKSFEESFLSFLPKIFMVIFVIGVLWGLKLASDYGFLSDALKVMAGYAVAIVLFGVAVWADLKHKLKEALVISLYGGAFIVGILATAAGAILYEVLSLNVALLIAFVFIAYGMAISFVKKNEWLTVFVAFTSLLLPYLLDVMAFNPLLIAGYILLLTLALQPVIWKFGQVWAMYVSTFFGIVAIIYLANTNVDSDVLLSYSIVLLFSVFLVGWYRLIRASYRVHLGLLFSMNSYVTLALLIIFSVDERAIVVSAVLLGVQAAYAGFVWVKGRRDVFEMVAVAAILTLLYIVLCLDVRDDMGLLLALVFVTVGMLVALKLHLNFMKLMYVGLFGIVALVIYFSQTIPAWFSMENGLLLLVIVFAVAGYIYAKRLPRIEGLFSRLMKVFYVMECIPVVIFCFAWAYIDKFDAFYPVFGRTEYGWSYEILRDILLALLLLVALILPKKWVGLVLASFAIAVFTIKSIFVHFDNWAYNGQFADQLFVRLAFLIVLVTIALDFMWKRRIYQNFAQWLHGYMEWVYITLLLAFIFILFGTTDFFATSGKISAGVAVMLNTFSIFIAAILSMLYGKKNGWKYANYLGIGLLCVGFVKMIFFDLTALDILIRAILFIVIGAVGLVVSSRLMKK